MEMLGPWIAGSGEVHPAVCAGAGQPHMIIASMADLCSCADHARPSLNPSRDCGR
jgi:hypothetical protein